MARKRVGANRRLKIAGKRKKTPKKQRTGGWPVFTYIKAFGLVVCIGGAGFWGTKKAAPYIDKFDFLKIENITVKGNKQVNTSEVLSFASIEKGLFMLDLKVSEISKKLQKIPWIEKVNIKRKIPHTVVITVHERKPIAFVNLGTIYMTDRSGYLWPLKPNTYWNVPVISGLKDTTCNGTIHRLNEEGLLQMNSFFDEIHKIDNDFSLGISQIDFGEKGVVSVRLESIPVHVELNSITISKSLNNVGEILKRIEDNTKKTPRHINLRYNNIAFVR